MLCCALLNNHLELGRLNWRLCNHLRLSSLCQILVVSLTQMLPVAQSLVTLHLNGSNPQVEAQQALQELEKLVQTGPSSQEVGSKLYCMGDAISVALTIVNILGNDVPSGFKCTASN